MALTLYLSLLLSVCLTSTLASPHITSVDYDSVPTFHQKEFLSFLGNPSKRRAVLDLDQQFIRLNGVVHAEGSTHDFIIKQDINSNVPVFADGEPADHLQHPVFHGYSTEDLFTVISFTFPNLHNDDLSPTGTMIGDGSGHKLELHPDHGLYLAREEPNNVAHDHMSYENILDAHFRPSNKKRQFDLVNFDSGIHPNATVYNLNILIETDSRFLRKNFGGNISAAVAFILSNVAICNVVELRDLRLQWVITKIGLYPRGRAPASDYSTLGTYLSHNPRVSRGLAAAGIWQSEGDAGTGWVGEVATPTGTFHIPYTPNDSFWLVLGFLHESGHVLGVVHTHEGPSNFERCGITSNARGVPQCAFDPVVDVCWLEKYDRPGTLPDDGVGVIMSYCHQVNGYKAIQLTHGMVGRHGHGSERVCQTMRKTTVAAVERCNRKYPMTPCGVAVFVPENEPQETNLADPGQIHPVEGDVSDDCLDVSPTSEQISLGGRGAFCSQVLKYGWCKNAGDFKPSLCDKTCGRCPRDIQKRVETDVNVSPEVIRDEVVLFDQGESCTANRGIPTASFETMMATSRALDDFVVPKGQVWELAKVLVAGSWFAGTIEESMDWSVSIFNRDKLFCRNVVNLTAPIDARGEVTEIKFEHPCPLVGGHLEWNGEQAVLVEGDETYWITVAPHVDFAETNNLWYWSFSESKNGKPFMYKDSANIWKNDKSCQQWTEASLCGFDLGMHKDLCFQLGGYPSKVDEESWRLLVKPVNPVRDSGIGTDNGHHRLLARNEAVVRKETSATLIVNHNSNQEVLTREPVKITSINPHTYGITSLVLASVSLTVIIGLIVFFVRQHQNRPRPERV